MTFEARGLTIGFGELTLQRDLAFALAPGQRLVVMGPSGCGKTTLLRALAGLDAPIAGELALDGASPATLGYPAWRRRVVYVAQRATFFGDPVREELARPFGYRSARAAFDTTAAEAALDAVGLAHKIDAPTSELSEGERQRVALVRAALLAPDALLLDEPTSALDVDTTARVEAYLEGLAAALVIVTHDPSLRERMATQRLELEAHPDAG